MKVQWRLLARDVATGKGQYVWASYSTKKTAMNLAKSFNELHNDVKWEVYRQVGNQKERVY